MRTILLLSVALSVSAVGYRAQPLAIGSIHVYQRHVAWLADRAGARCRFTPSCSRYAEIVIARDGVVRGGWKAIRRVARCGPWTPNGTRDDPTP